MPEDLPFLPRAILDIIMLTRAASPSCHRRPALSGRVGPAGAVGRRWHSRRTKMRTLIRSALLAMVIVIGFAVTPAKALYYPWLYGGYNPLAYGGYNPLLSGYGYSPYSYLPYGGAYSMSGYGGYNPYLGLSAY